MAKYSVKFEIEVIVDEDFAVGDVDYSVDDVLTDKQWNEIISDATDNIYTSDLSGNVVEIVRVEDDEEEDWEDDEEDEGEWKKAETDDEIKRLAELKQRLEMPWDYGKHFD